MEGGASCWGRKAGLLLRVEEVIALFYVFRFDLRDVVGSTILVGITVMKALVLVCERLVVLGDGVVK